MYVEVCLDGEDTVQEWYNVFQVDVIERTVTLTFHDFTTAQIASVYDVTVKDDRPDTST